MAGLNISPGESAAAYALGGDVRFAPVNVGTQSTKDRALFIGGAVVLALAVVYLLRKK